MTDDLHSLVARLLADPLVPARAHVAAGGRAVGLASAEVPVEPIRAAGALAVTLPVDPRGPTAKADAYLESQFSAEARSVLQSWLDGRFDALSAIVFPRSADNWQRLYYYASELRRRGVLAGPEPILYDLAKIDRPSSERHSVEATARLAARLGAAVADLPAAIAATDRRRALFARLQATRAGDAAPRGSLINRIVRASGFGDADAFDAALEAALPLEPAPSSRRVLLAGSAPPDETLHGLIEAAGGNVVADLHEAGPERLGPPIGTSSDPIAALARHQRALTVGARSFVDRAAATVAAARAARAEAVVIRLTEQEEALSWDLPAQRRALEAAGLPVLAITRAPALPTEAEAADIGRFLSGLGGMA